MIKIIGAILLVGGAALLGLSASTSLTIRARTLSGFSQVLNIMHSEIAERLTPLGELMERLGTVAVSPLDVLFRRCAEEMKSKPDIPFALIWKKQLKRAEYLKLKAQETETLSALGNVLGRYGAEEQAKAIAHTARCVDSMATSAEHDRSRLGSLYAKLGLICGVAVVIVFI